ncbi:MAG: RNA-directed DNA polymerase, partial [Candidatus Saccharimonadales bacterium]
LEEQGGFREDRGCSDQRWILNEIIQSRREKRKKTYLLFVDFTKAYDLVWRESILYHLDRMGIRGKCWRVIRDMYREVRSSVKVNGRVSEKWASEVGTRQGSVLSPILFSLAVNGIIERLRAKGYGVRMGEELVPGLLFADDLVIMADSEEELRLAIEEVEQWVREWRFIVNNKKCGVMVVAESSKKAREIKRKWMLCGEEVKEVESYKYLGIEQQKRKGWSEYINRVVKHGSRVVGQMKMIGVHQHGLRPTTGRRLAQSLLFPILEYGNDVLVLNKHQQQQIEAVVMRAAKVICGMSEHATVMSDAVRGELGWHTMAERNEVAKLKYFHRLRTLPNTRL